jgi:hypothetical protein
MSFWDLSDGQTAKDTGAEYEVPGGNMDPIPAGSSVLAMIDQIAWDKKKDTFEEFISARWTVLAPEEYKNRKVFHKLWVTDLDPSAKDQDAAVKKRDKARKMLAAIDANAGGKLTAKPGIPSSDDLLALQDKPMIVTLMTWSMAGNHGNWVSAVAPKGSKELHIAPAKPLPSGGGSPGGARDDFGAGAGQTRSSVIDDEIPF